MKKFNRTWLHQRWKQFWAYPSVKGSHQSAVFPWRLKNIARTRSERFVAWLWKREYPHYGPKAQLPELFHRRDLAFFALESGQLHFDRALQPKEKIETLELYLGYVFKDRELCRQALTTYPNNRLALLGDRVLTMTVCELWYKTDHSTRRYSDMESDTLSRAALAVTALKIELQKCFSGPPRTGENSKKNQLAEGFEAVIGAVYVDSGYSSNAVKTIVHKLGLDQHRNLKTWEQMTDKQRTNLTLENEKAAKRADPKRADAKRGSTDAHRVTQTEALPVHAPMLNVVVTEPTTKATAEAHSLSRMLRRLQGLPIRRSTRQQVQYLARAARKERSAKSIAAQLALRRYLDRVTAGHFHSRPGPTKMFKTIMKEQRGQDQLEEQALCKKEEIFMVDNLTLATVTKGEDVEGPARMITEQARGLYVTPEEQEVREARGEDEAQSAVEQKSSYETNTKKIMRHREKDMRVRIAQERVSTSSLENEEMMHQLEDQQNTNQFEKYTVEETAKVNTWRDMFIFGKEYWYLEASGEAVHMLRKARALEQKISDCTASIISIAELQRPRGWPTHLQLRDQVTAYITPPAKNSYHQNFSLTVSTANVYEMSIAKAIRKRLKFGSDEWKQDVRATFHRATLMNLVVDTMVQGGHATHWKKEWPDQAQVHYVQASELATIAIKSTAELGHQTTEDTAHMPGPYQTTKLAIRVFAALEKKFMSNNASNLVQPMPWEEAVRETVRELEEDKMHVTVAEEEETRSAEEEIKCMVEAEKRRMVKAEKIPTAKAEKIPMATAEHLRIAEAEKETKIQKRDTARKEDLNLHMVAQQMSAWRDEFIQPGFRLTFEEHTALHSGHASVKRLPATSQVNIRFLKLQLNIVSITRALIEEPATRQCGDWASYPPVSYGHVLSKAEEYCQPRGRKRLRRWMALWSYKYRHVIAYAIERGFRIGSQEWNEGVEALFHRAVLVHMGIRHMRFAATPALQDAALEAESQFDQTFRNILRNNPSIRLADHRILNYKLTIYQGHIPSQIYQKTDGRAKLPTDFVVTRLLRMIGPQETGMMKLDSQSSSASAPLVLDPEPEASAITLDVEGSDCRGLNTASEVRCIAATGMLALVARPENAHGRFSSDTTSEGTENKTQASTAPSKAGASPRKSKGTKKREASISKKTPRPKDKQIGESTTMVTDPLMEAERVSDLGNSAISDTAVLNALSTSEPTTASKRIRDSESMSPSIAPIGSMSKDSQTADQSNSPQSPTSQYAAPRSAEETSRVANIVRKDMCTKTQVAKNQWPGSLSSPPSRGPVSKSTESSTNATTIVSKFQAWRDHNAADQTRDAQSHPTSDPAPGNAEAHQRGLVPIIRPTVSPELAPSSPSSPPQDSASVSAETRPVATTASSTFQSKRADQAVDKSSYSPQPPRLQTRHKEAREHIKEWPSQPGSPVEQEPGSGQWPFKVRRLKSRILY